MPPPPIPPDARWRDRFRTAVAEIAANVIKHAYPPSAEVRPLGLEVQVFPDEVVAQFADCGTAWEPTEEPIVPDPFDLPEGGLGLAIARGALDELSYRREPDGRNVWRLAKRFPASV